MFGFMSNTPPINTSRELFKLIWPFRWRLGVGLGAVVITTLCMLAIPQYLKAVFDEALQHKDVAQLNSVFFMMSGVVLLLAFMAGVRNFFLRYTAMKIIVSLRCRVFQHALGLDIGYYEIKSTGEILSRMINDIEIVLSFIRTSSVQFVRAFFLSIGALAFLFYMEWQLTLMLLVVGPVFVIMLWQIGRFSRKRSKARTDAFAKAMAVVESAITGIRTVRVFGAENQTYLLHNNFIQKCIGLTFEIDLANAFFLAIVILTGFSGALLTLYYGSYQVINGDISLGTLMAYFLTLAFLADGLGNLAQFWPAYQEALGSTERVFELLAEQPKVTEAAQPVPLPAVQRGRAVTFENVGFHYPSRAVDDRAIHEFALQVAPGETVALVGPSGGGKSTLFSLLLRFYDVQQGAILLDGVDVRQLAFPDLRRAVSLVAQEPTIFSASVYENVAYGAPDATEAEVMAAVRAAHAWDFIQDLPAGLATEVGEKGVRLSGGQKQRLAIARTILTDPDVLLLDEATSHLDAASEQHVQAALEALQQNRTTLVIAHRLSTVKNADRIVVLAQGRKIAEGKHSALLKSCPLYKKLAQLQLLD